MDKLDNNSPISNYWNQPNDYKEVIKQEILTIASDKILFISSFLGDTNLELIPIIWSSLHISKLLKKNKTRKIRKLLKKVKDAKLDNTFILPTSTDIIDVSSSINNKHHHVTQVHPPLTKMDQSSQNGT